MRLEDHPDCDQWASRYYCRACHWADAAQLSGYKAYLVADGQVCPLCAGPVEIVVCRLVWKVEPGTWRRLWIPESVPILQVLDKKERR